MPETFFGALAAFLIVWKMGSFVNWQLPRHQAGVLPDPITGKPPDATITTGRLRRFIYAAN